MTDIVKSIKAINNLAEFSINANDINQITWHNGTTPIPANEILAKQQELITEYNSNQYQRDRAKEYPSIQEQLDMQYWDKVNNTNNWQTKVNEIKVKYPKP
jgi:hypothetical protein